MNKIYILIIIILLIIISLAGISSYILFFNQEDSEIINNGEINLSNEDSYRVKVVDENNHGIPNKTVTMIISINNEEIKVNLTTDSNGFVKYELKNLTAGNCTITSIFNGDSKYKGSSLIQTIWILEKTSTFHEKQEKNTNEFGEHKHVGDGKGYCRYCGVDMTSLPNYGDYDENNYIYNNDGDKMYWVENDGYDGSFQYLKDI